MAKPTWQLTTPINAVIFDCDGTLSRIEGIDELAAKSHFSDIVQSLTAEAMGKSGMRADLYAKRLELVSPTQDQMNRLGDNYIDHQAPNVAKIINILQSLNKSIYIVSAGLFPAVAIFGKYLQIPEKNIFAVDIKFDSQGNYIDFDHHSPLINKFGKRVVVNEIKKQHAQIAFIGDGLSDYEVHDLTDRFIGYGGSFYRKNLEESCEFYIRTFSMAPLLPLLLTESELDTLTQDQKQTYDLGLSEMKNQAR